MYDFEIRKIMDTPVNPSFTILNWGLRVSKLYRRVCVISHKLSSWRKTFLVYPVRHFRPGGNLTKELDTWSSYQAGHAH